MYGHCAVSGGNGEAASKGFWRSRQSDISGTRRALY